MAQGPRLGNWKLPAGGSIGGSELQSARTCMQDLGALKRFHVRVVSIIPPETIEARQQLRGHFCSLTLLAI